MLRRGPGTSVCYHDPLGFEPRTPPPSVKPPLLKHNTELSRIQFQVSLWSSLDTTRRLFQDLAPSTGKAFCPAPTRSCERWV